MSGVVGFIKWGYVGLSVSRGMSGGKFSGFHEVNQTTSPSMNLWFCNLTLKEKSNYSSFSNLLPPSLLPPSLVNVGLEKRQLIPKEEIGRNRGRFRKRLLYTE